MDKTIKINLAGILFQIDEEAYHLLRDYLQAINIRFQNVHGGNETIEDIESRIAEIFQSQQSPAGAISKENIEAMIGIIGKPEDFDHSENPAGSSAFYNQKRRLYRNPDDSIVSGVCGGIGAYLNTDPVLFRILFVLFAVFFGVGFFVYIALWIALPSASTDSRKREMHGNTYHSSHSQNRQPDITSGVNAPSYNAGYSDKSTVGNAFNEIFRAIGRVCYIILRIFLIIIGVTFVLTGFITILCFVMVFIFKYPGAFSTDAFDMHLFYFPDFLNYIVNPSVAPWIIALTLIAVVLPLLALIYWGVKMIFWFRAKDGILSLVGLVVWIMAITALSLILFNEGISFAETARTSTQKIFLQSLDTLYIKTNNRVDDLKFDKELSFKKEGYTVFINEEKKELYIRPYLNVNKSYDDGTKVEVWKHSSGRNKLVATKRSEELIYNYRISGDTLFLDEYFTIPSGRKWSADNVDIDLFVPKGTILKFDSASEGILHHRYNYDSEENNNSIRWGFHNSWWTLTDEGLRSAHRHAASQN